MEQDLGSILAYALYFIVLFVRAVLYCTVRDRALPYEGHRRYAELHARRP